MENRKKDHIDLAFESQISRMEMDTRFHYEPLLSAHLPEIPPITFLGKTFRVPLWVSSMTGGTAMAGTINHNLARLCNEFGFGMGLGSCRILLDDNKYFPDFNVREVIGRDQALFANLGIAQMEGFFKKNNTGPVRKLVEKLQADGLIIHINPMQESLQPEGDVLTIPPVEVIEWSLDRFDFPLIVKEVGQGMGPASLRRLLQLPLAALDYAAFGGTNFARLELMRSSPAAQDYYQPLSLVGQDAGQMTGMINELLTQIPEPACKQVIVSGGIKNFLDGYYHISKLKLPAIYGMASNFLKFARGEYAELKKFTEYQVRGLGIAMAFLRVK